MRPFGLAVLMSQLSLCHAVQLSSELTLTWSVASDVITGTMVCPEGQWCSIGFGSSMSGSDTITCSQATCKDGKVTGHSSPSDDAQQDVTTVGTPATVGGKTTYTWTRPLNTGDAADVVVALGLVQIIWGTGPYTGGMRQHTSITKGSKQVDLALAAVTPVPDTPVPAGAPQTRKLTDGFSFTWSLTSATTLTMTFECAEAMWCSIGFGELMSNADTITCGKATCKDGKVSGYAAPTDDAQQDVTTVGTPATAGGKTTYTWTRLLNTGDAADVVVALGPVKIIWGTGPYNGAVMLVHTKKDKATIELVAPGTTPVPDTPVPDTSVPDTAVPTPVPPPATDVPAGATQTRKLTDGFSFTWSLASATTLTMTFECADGMWCSIGFGVSMANADTITCGKATCKDGRVLGKPPTDDAQQDVTTVGTPATAGGKTTYTWTRPLSTGDAEDIVVALGSVQIIWAVGPYNGTAMDVHSSRGNTAIEVLTLGAPVPSGEHTQTRKLTDGFSFTWSLASATTLTMTFECADGMWCSIGFGVSMANADTITCGKATCKDGRVLGKPPTDDAQQDVTVVGTPATADGKTTYTWTRPLNTGDAEDVVVALGSVQIIWAVGPYNGTAMDVHSSRGNTAIEVLAPGSTPVPDGEHTHSPVPPLPPGVTEQSVTASDSFTYKWKLTADGKEIEMTFECAEGVWCAVGFGKSMADADTVTCSGNTCKDGKVSGHTKPVDDASQDTTFVSGSTRTRQASTLAGTSTYVWTRKLVTGDAGDAALTLGRNDLIWAWGALAGGAMQQHGTKGEKGRGGDETAFNILAAPAVPAGSATFSDAFRAEWKVSADELSIEFTYYCKEGNWCSLGLGSSMSDADTYTCDDKTCVDGRVSGQSAPVSDTVNDVTKATTTVSNGVSKQVFTRKVATGDAADRVITRGTQDIIWGTGTMNGAALAQHASGSRGTARINFFTGAVELIADPDVRLWYLAGSLLCLVVLLAGGALVRRHAGVRTSGVGRMLSARGLGVVPGAVLVLASAVIWSFTLEEADWNLRFGYAAQILLSVILLLVAGPASPFTALLLLPYERLVMYHGTLGLLFAVCTALHGLPYLFDSDRIDVNLREWGKAGPRDVHPMPGFLGMVFAFAVFFTALIPVRRKVYHLFLICHRLFTPLVVIFAALHTFRNLWFMLPGLLALLWRVVMNESRSAYTIQSKQDSTDMMYSKVTVVSKRASDSIQGVPSPGAVVRLRWGGNGLVAHPFSLITSPLGGGAVVVVKNMGVGTSTDSFIKGFRGGETVSVSHPSGTPTIELSDYDKVVLVGGGVGVTPLLGTLYHLRGMKAAAKQTTFGSDAAAPAKTKVWSRTGSGGPRVHLVWSVRDEELVGLLRDELLELADSVSCRLVLHYTGKNREHTALQGLPAEVHYTRPAYPDVLRHVAGKDVNETRRDDAASPGNSEPPVKSVGVFVCGPAPMLSSVKDAVKLASSYVTVDLHTEVFEL